MRTYQEDKLPSQPNTYKRVKKLSFFIKKKKRKCIALSFPKKYKEKRFNLKYMLILSSRYFNVNLYVIIP